MMVSLMVSMSSSSCNFSNRFLNSNYNLIFCDSICVAPTLVLLVASSSSIIFQFDVARNHSVVISNVNLVDDCYFCDDV